MPPEQLEKGSYSLPASAPLLHLCPLQCLRLFQAVSSFLRGFCPPVILVWHKAGSPPLQTVSTCFLTRSCFCSPCLLVRGHFVANTRNHLTQEIKCALKERKQGKIHVSPGRKGTQMVFLLQLLLELWPCECVGDSPAQGSPETTLPIH
jgi:hypothetical protein